MEASNPNLLKSDKIKIEILKLLSDGNPHTPSELAIALRTNSKTIDKNSGFLELIGAIRIQEISTRRTVKYMRITNEGIALRRKVEERIEIVKRRK
jgi:DNA-binding MarR family transcriptional regulator